MIDVKRMQKAVGVTADGIAGIGTFTAVFAKCGAQADRASELGLAAAVLFPQYGLMDNALRIAHFLGQTGHESGGFVYMEEIWGPTAAQRGYEGRADLGNTVPRDGMLFKGRGPIQITGRANYRKFGRLIGIDIERHPELAAVPSIGLRLACEYWKDRGLNALADKDDLEGITRRINGGTNGLVDRQVRTKTAKGWLS